MKSKVFLSLFLLSIFLAAQTPFPSGIKLPNATEGNTSTTPIRSVTINSSGVVNGWEEMSAENTAFNGTESAITSTNVQDAIDEVVGMISSGGGGTVTSIGLSAPTGLQVSNSPITSAGTISLTYQSGYFIPTSASQSNWDTAFGWGDHASAGYLTSYTETDPTIFSWAKASTKPTYTWSEITGKPTFHTVATSGDYNDLIGKPTIPAQFNPIAGTNITITGTYPNLTFNSSGGGGGTWGLITGTLSNQTDLNTALGNKANSVHTHNLSAISDVTATASEVNVLDGITSTTTELNYTDGVTSNIQTQLDGKQNSDATLTALAGLTTSANSMIYATASDTFSTVTSSAGGRALLNSAGTSNTIPYFSASNTVGLITTTTGGRALLNNSGTANNFPYYSATNTVSLAPITAFARTILDDADAATVRTTIGAGTGNGTVTSVAVGTGLNQVGAPTTSSTISLKNATSSEIGGVKVWKGTQSAYDALGTYDSNTLYFIEDNYPNSYRKTFEITADQTWTTSHAKLITVSPPLTSSDWTRKIKATITWTDATTGYNEMEYFLGKGVITSINGFTRNGTQLSLALNVSSSFTIPAGALLILEY